VPPSTPPVPSALPWFLPATWASPSATSLLSSLVEQSQLAPQSSCMAGLLSAVQHLQGVASQYTKAYHVSVMCHPSGVLGHMHSTALL
jgi:hypothetical protein